MSDPVTVGTLVASALAMGAEATLKGFVGESVKDAYKALKNKIAVWAGHDADALEASPKSPARQAIIAETVEQLTEQDKASLVSLAEELTAKLHAEAATVGVDIGHLEAVRVSLRNVAATSGTAVRVGTLKAQDLEIDGLSVGAPPGKA